jgi:hypothetical protein
MTGVRTTIVPAVRRAESRQSGMGMWIWRLAVLHLPSRRKPKR